MTILSPPSLHRACLRFEPFAGSTSAAQPDAVANCIAWDEKSPRLLVTGKP
ncbi:hypothetical protein QCD71_06525 [Sphingomonas sp. PsM26]|nr:hypothetical protein [Sphingomonas sp. PsM26]